jgi:peptide/nickel transport system substrate-binding protein
LSTDLTRRQALLAPVACALASAAATATTRLAIARGRILLGGQLSMRVPWPVATVDPHRQDDPCALLFGGALFDSLFTLDERGGVVPSLAESLPEACPDGSRVVLREGLHFASGKPVSTRDVVASIARSRAKGARGWLDAAGVVRATKSGPASTLVFTSRFPDRLAHALASPLTAIVPETFTPERPDGTGPFAVQRTDPPSGTLVLDRNRFAANGPAFLDRATIAPAADLAASLRAFESGEDDLGWLGLGLHEPRRGAVPFDAGVLGWAILCTGDLARGWGLPGVAQRLADGIDPGRLAHLGVQADWAVDPSEGWGAQAAALLVRDDSPWLLELARAVAAALSRDGHEIATRPVPAAELAAARESRAYALALDLVRPYDPTPLGTSVALAAADDPARAVDLARHPPRGAAPSPRAACRLLRIGVVAPVRFAGGHMPDLPLPTSPMGGVDLGAISRPRSRVG